MPMFVAFHPLNDKLADPASDDYATAREAILEADNCEAVVESLGLLADLDDEVVAEAHAVFTFLPDGVDQGILAAYRDAVSRSAPVVLHWEEDTSDGDLAVSHRAVEESGTVHVTVVAPDGRRFR